MRRLTISQSAFTVTQMSDQNDTRTAYQKKVGTLHPKAVSLDAFTVRQSLPTLEAVRNYDNYLKEHKRKLRQLEKLAAGELTPSEEGYL